MRKIITSIDIGSDEIKLIVGEVFGQEINVLCALSEEAKGFKDYQITDAEEFVIGIKNMISMVSDRLGFKIKKVIVNIPTSNNGFVISEAANTITSADGMVSSADILRILQSTAYNKISASDELIGVIPLIFRVDDNETDNPYGKNGKVLMAKAVLVTAPRQEVIEIINIFEKCDLEIIDITVTGLVDYYNFKNEELDKTTGIIVNIGAYKTNLSVISKGIYINNEVIDAGGVYIEKDISYIYKFKKSDAQFLKDNLALASIRRANPKETVRMVNIEGEELHINQYELTEIVASRVAETLKLIKKSINHLTKKQISYIIITGGLTELKDFPIALVSVFGETAKIGNINTIGIRSNKYSVALGMIKYFNEKLKLRHREYSTVSEADAESMCNIDSKGIIAGDSILGKVFGYFFDN